MMGGMATRSARSTEQASGGSSPWPALLKRLSAHLLEVADDLDREQLSPEVLASGWLGRPPA
jgi:hypothetical protein